MISTAFMVTVELGLALGVTNIGSMGGCWEHKVDERWWIAINGHREPTKTTDGTEVPGYSLLVRSHEWPAAVLNPSGGVFVSSGDSGLCSEDIYIAAIEAATLRAKGAA